MFYATTYCIGEFLVKVEVSDDGTYPYPVRQIVRTRWIDLAVEVMSHYFRVSLSARR